MKLTYRLYTLELRNRFTLANSSRTTTPAVLVEIEVEGVIGYGEASLPPYLGEDQASVVAFYRQIDPSRLTCSLSLDDNLRYIDSIAFGNCAAKAAIDIALHDLYGKLGGFAWHIRWECASDRIPPTSYTIGIDTPDMIRKKTIEADQYHILKVKLGTPSDKLLIDTIRDITDKPLCVDANQGWTDRYYALEMVRWCKEQGVLFVEQPMPREQRDDVGWLTAHSPLPIIADEAFQRLSDLDEVKNLYSGVNIKLMKCTGMGEAHRIALTARREGLRVMLGCMTETSCAISAASQLAALADWVDLDGHLLIANDCFKGATFTNGRIVPTDGHGIGIERIE